MSSMANIHNGIIEIISKVVLHAYYNILITNIKRLNHITDDQFKLLISRMAPSIYTQVISRIE